MNIPRARLGLENREGWLPKVAICKRGAHNTGKIMKWTAFILELLSRKIVQMFTRNTVINHMHLEEDKPFPHWRY